MFDIYIKQTWARLTRNALDAALDPKVSSSPRNYIYISPKEDAAAIRAQIDKRRRARATTVALDVRTLPEDFTVEKDHGILYLPHDYVVPGGRFNEMYDWDSYWIVLGLIQDGLAPLARGMVDNFVYQIHHYGYKILNANRTYYLTRSQPPVLAPMAASVLPTLPPDERPAFLANVAEALDLEYMFFWKAQRYDGERGLFHYGNPDQAALGPCPEVLFGERDANGQSHYEKLVSHLATLPKDDPIRQRFLTEAANDLTPEAYAGDRAMRESGFDPSMHMGFYGLEAPDFAPPCLNSLLYVQCQWLGQAYRELGNADRAQFFRREAAQLYTSMQKYMWSESAGLFCNYNTRVDAFSAFPFITSVYPLWAGIATPQQAERFRDNLPLFETDFGLKNTPVQSGCQWDSPFMWAPLVHLTVAGLHRYGFTEDAQRIAQKFLTTVKRVYDQTGANFEKYNADTGTIEDNGIIDVGYSVNVVGFGWTNGAAIVLNNWLQNGCTAPLHTKIEPAPAGEAL